MSSLLWTVVFTVMNRLFRLNYDMSSMLGIENSHSESDDMKTAISQAHLEGKISSGLTIWYHTGRAFYDVYPQDLNNSPYKTLCAVMKSVCCDEKLTHLTGSSPVRWVIYLVIYLVMYLVIYLLMYLVIYLTW